MKPFINKLLSILSMCAILVACSAKQEPPANEQPAEPEVVEEISVETPLTAPQPSVAPAPTPAKVAPKPASAKTLYPGEVINHVKAWDKKLKFLKTNFTQTAQYDGIPVSKSVGVLYYDKDKNLLRLDTDDGDGKIDQSAVTDKQKILILDGQGREITTLSWTEWQQGQPNQALFDFGNYTALLARHNAVLKEPYLLELTPKEGEKYTLYLTLDKADYFPTTIKIVADLMQTEAVLSDVQKNQPLAFDTFRAGGLFK